MSTVYRDLLQQQLDNFSVQRHDFLNYFQVIKGYIQLNMPEKALEYMDEALLELLPQQNISRIAEKTIVAILLNLYFRLHKLGIGMEIKYPEEMKNEEFWTARWQAEYADSFYGYTMECVESIPQELDFLDSLAEIVLSSTEQGFSFEFKLYREQEQIKQKSFAIP